MTEPSKQIFEGNSLEKFLDVCNNVLDKHSPRKSKSVLDNHSSFMNRELSKACAAFMTRTSFRNKFSEEKTEGNRGNESSVKLLCYPRNPIQDGLFRGCSRMGRSLKSVTHIIQWWKLAQLYLTQRRSKKYMNYVTLPLSSADISIFSTEISNFAISRNTDIDCILIHNLYLF